MTTYEMKNTLDSYPPDVLLQIGLPDIKFYAEGTQLQALCPFHEDHKLGNFGYNLSKGCWRCFVCGKGGSGVYSSAISMTAGTVPFPVSQRRLPLPSGRRE